MSYYSLDEDGVPTFEDNLNVGGLNPFGIAFVPSTPESSSLLGIMTIGILGATSSRFRKK